MSRRSVTEATWPERMDAGVGAAGAGDRDRTAFERRKRLFEQRLHRGARRLTLPSDEPGAVVGDRQLQVNQRQATTGRDPGFTTGSPCAHSGQASGW